MVKRRISILFLCIAYLVMLGDHVLPHHHHEITVEDHHHGEAEGGLHHHEHHDEHHDADHSNHHGKDAPLWHYDHFTWVYTSPDESRESLQSPVTDGGIPPQTFVLESPKNQHTRPQAQAEPTIYISPHSRCAGLRAPPFLIV